MRDQITAIGERLLDGADLLIDLATLGEYGLEPADSERVPEPCAARTRVRAPVCFDDAIARFERAAA